MHKRKAKCPPSLTAWTNYVGIVYGRGANLKVAMNEYMARKSLVMPRFQGHKGEIGSRI